MSERVDVELAMGAAFLCALGALTEQQRYVVVMHNVHGATYAQLAAQLGVSLQRIYVVNRTGLAKLRRALGVTHEFEDAA